MDQAGIPGVSILTEAFRDGMEMQMGVLGFDAAAHYVPHPIQPLTPEELAVLADGVVEPVLALLTADSV